MHRLLILGCSQRKNPAADVLPAIDRYDGPAFRVLRKFLKEAPQHPPVVLILSAKYGLIESATPIPDYDCQMSTALADRLRPSVLESLGLFLPSRSWRWRSIGLCVGKVYRGALHGMEQLAPEGVRVEVLGGGQGRRLTSLHRWLRVQHHAMIERRRAERGGDAK
jgi:hypothetical protein